MKIFLLVCMLGLLNLPASAQAGPDWQPEELAQLARFEDTLKVLGDSILDARDDLIRQNACVTFIKTLVRALKTEHSFYYPFDSLQRISILEASNHSFRIFNWVLPFSNGTYRYYGTIQMNSGGELKLFPLFDYSHGIVRIADTVTNHEKWPGALYYRMVEVKNASNKTFYTLFGWNGMDQRSNRKIVEVLTFNSKKLPVFGAAIFDFGRYDDRNKIRRYMVEYKEDAKVTLNFDDEQQWIVTDHLQPESEATRDDLSTYVPDGTYEGFRWENGKWHYLENLFTETQKDPPFPNPVDFEKEKRNYPPKQQRP